MGNFNKKVQKFGDKNQRNNKNFTKVNKTKPPIKKTKAEQIQELKRKEKLEREAKIAQYKKKRLEKTKVVTKKTSRGQPLMKNRIEYLLKQIQESKKN